MSIKKEFFEKLLPLIRPEDYFLTGDLGFGVLDDIKKKLGKNFINVGISEQAMIGIAAGLSLSGKRVYTYTISSFYLRAIEQLKLDIYGQGARVTMIGGGNVGSTYENFGLSHYLYEEDVEYLQRYFKVIQINDTLPPMGWALAYDFIFLPR